MTSLSLEILVASTTMNKAHASTEPSTQYPGCIVEKSLFEGVVQVYRSWELLIILEE